MAYELNETLSPITRSERLKVNENWERIQTALNSLQFQVNALVGGDLGDLIRDINEALGKLDDLLEEGEELTTEMKAALVTFENYVNTLEVYVPRMEQGIDDIESLMPVLTNLRDQLTTLNNNVTNAEGLRVTAENGRVSAENGRVSAENARVIAENIRQNNELNRIETMEEMENVLDNLESFSYSSSQEYNFPNLVLYNGSTYMALQRVTGLTPSNDGANWRLVAQRGTDGTGSVSSVNGIFPDPNGNVTIDVGGDIINNLISTRTDASLSANQGRVLNENKLDVSNKATSTEATDGVNNTKWMTPLRTMEAASASLQQSIASETEANAGTANDKVMTPLRVNNVTGTKTNLTTTNKTNLVSAINEVKTNITEHIEQNDALIKHKASQISIEPISGMDATNVQDGLAEAFLLGNSRKQDVVDKLLLVDDSLPIDQDSSWTDILNAISMISTGKKWMSGTVSTGSGLPAFYFADSTNTIQWPFIEVPLTFKPSVIIIESVSTSTNRSGGFYTENMDGKISDCYKVTDYNDGQNSSRTTRNFKATKLPAYVTSSGFKLPVASTTNFRYLAIE